MTMFNFHGCYHHGHSKDVCTNKYLQAKWSSMTDEEKKCMNKKAADTKAVDQYLRTNLMVAHNYVAIYECEWDAIKKKDQEVRLFVEQLFPYYRPPSKLTGRQLLEAVLNGSFTGFVTASIRVKDEYREKFAQFPPLFIHREIGSVKILLFSPSLLIIILFLHFLGREQLHSPMLDFVKEQNLLKKPQKLLISALSCEKLTMLTTYLKYLVEECGCEVLSIESAVYWRLEQVFRPFFEEVLQKRIDAQNLSNVGLSNSMKLVCKQKYINLYNL